MWLTSSPLDISGRGRQVLSCEIYHGITHPWKLLLPSFQKSRRCHLIDQLRPPPSSRLRCSLPSLAPIWELLFAACITADIYRLVYLFCLPHQNVSSCRAGTVCHGHCCPPPLASGQAHRGYCTHVLNNRRSAGQPRAGRTCTFLPPRAQRSREGQSVQRPRRCPEGSRKEPRQSQERRGLGAGFRPRGLPHCPAPRSASCL